MSSEIYCCVGTAKSPVREAVHKAVDLGDASAFRDLTGDWCFYLCKDNVLCFTRDVFARKSLCWRRQTASDGRWSFELSVFPGEIDVGWNEVEPGTLYIFECLANAAEISDIQVKNNTCLPSTTVDEPLDFRCTMTGEVFNSVRVFSHFSQMEDDKLLALFASVQYTAFDSTPLLRPTTRRIPPEEMGTAVQEAAAEFTSRLEAAVRRTLPPLDEGFAVPILFSGGVDSLMIALLAGRVLRGQTQIVLINVAFGDTPEACSEAPDRQRCLEAFQYLCSIGDNYRLLLVNVDRAELVQCRERYIARAVAPLNSVLDDSLGCVLWFASRAEGTEYILADQGSGQQPPPLPPFAAFSLVGSGSDEQLGGYSRHRTRFETDGYEGLAAELHMEMCRIGRRNFGRDDRVTSSNGRPALAPFLDEEFVRWLSDVPLQVKVDYSQPRGIGEKRLLRVALAQMGVLESLYSAPKRAMQFGSRIAKLENRKEKASDRCERLLLSATSA